MSKYIDAEKLKAEIERRIEETKSMKPSFDQFWAGQISAFKGCLSIIDSLQQEQPDFPTTDEEVEKSLATHPKVEVPDKYKTPDWLFKKQEQQEVDLKEETKEWANLMVGASFPEQDGDFISEEDYRSVIRQTALHFYELGKNSK